MHIQLNINTDVEINCLTDLPKLKVLGNVKSSMKT